jgi:drug/metabolite transporter (DMT)-like permease
MRRMNAHPSRPWLLLAIAVSAWSLSPLLIYNSRGLAPSPVLGLYAVSIGAAIASVATVVLPSIDIRTAFRSVRAEGRLWSAAGVGLGAFVAYPLLYFSAIQSAPPRLGEPSQLPVADNRDTCSGRVPGFGPIT